MEGNKEEAQRCLSIAQRHRSSGNLTASLKFAKKSVSLYETPEAVAMVTIIEREITVSEASASGSGTSTPSGAAGTAEGGASSSRARASGVEEHTTSAHVRPGHKAAAGSTSANAEAGSSREASKKREYTAKQVEVVKRVISCQHHQYYEILAVDKTVDENGVKKAYRKLALALHPDKNGAPRADEAFKMVSKAFQVLSDSNLRAVYDANPHADPTQRGGGGGGGGGGMYSRGGGMPPGFGGGGMYNEVNPEDLFNAFFGGGGMGMGGARFGNANVFTFGGPGGFHFQTAGPRRRPGQAGAAGDGESSPITALLPLIILAAFALISFLPTLFADNTPDPQYSFLSSQKFDASRNTWQRGIQYYVNRDEFEKSKIWQSVPEEKRDRNDAAMYSPTLRGFERGIENYYINDLRSQCDQFRGAQQQEISMNSGFFGVGANHDKLKEIRARKSPACTWLREKGLLHNQAAGFI